MLTRRELVVAGGLALAGRLLPSPPGAWESEAPTVEIAMRSVNGGERVWFDPVGLLVRPGTTVRWVLVDGVHTTTAYHPDNGDYPRRIPDGAEPWDSGYLTAPGATFETTLEVEGVHDFLCRPHEAAGMVGRIVVDAGSSALPRSASPRVPTHTSRERQIDVPTLDSGVPPAALETFPALDEILRSGTVGPRPAGI